MKKNLLYTLAVGASLVLASCNGDYDDWASPQSYGPEASTNKYGISFTAGPDAQIVQPVRNDDVRLVALSSTDSNVTDFAVKSVTVNGESVDAIVEKGYIVVSAASLEKIIEKQFNSRAAEKRDIEVKSQVSVITETGEALTTDVTGTTTASLTPYATPEIDSEGYYLLGGFKEGNWNTANPIWMTDNGDGTYTATVNTAESGSNWFKFYRGSNWESGNWDAINEGEMGCETNGDTSLSGFIVYKNDPFYKDGVQTPVIEGEGTFDVTIDMKNLTYTVKRAEAKYYIVGNPQGWSDSDMRCMFYALGNNQYTYTTKWTNQWDLKIWDSKTFGNWDVAWGGINGDTSATGNLVNSDAGAFGPSTNGGWYTLSINMNTQTYEWTAISEPTKEYTYISLIGGFNSWNGDVDLTQITTAPHNWYVRYTISEDTELKFRANHEWNGDWGSDGSATIGSGIYYMPGGSSNIAVAAGTYDFYFNDITGNWNIVVVE